MADGYLRNGTRFDGPWAQPGYFRSRSQEESPYVTGAFALAIARDQAIFIFSMRMSNTGLTTPANYTLTPLDGGDPRNVSSVIIGDESIYVIITFDGDLSYDSEYRITAANLISRLNRDIVPPTSYDFFTEAAPVPALALLSAVAVNEVTVRVTFSVPVLDNDALVCLDSYELRRNDNSALLDVHAVTPENVLNPTYVDLTTDEQQEGTLYDVTIHQIEPA